jgi:hypothetical protein
MLIIKTNPVGIDWYIQQLQTKLHRLLIDSDHWNLADGSKYECYGRCNRNKTKDGYTAEVYTAGNDYKEVYWNDSLTAISFFGVSNLLKITAGTEADVHLVMFADLKKLALKDKDGSVIAHRSDEELRQMVLDVIGKNAFGFSVQSVETGIENVLKEYPGTRRDDRLKYVDMHPVHSFRINLNIKYNPDKNC